MVPHVDEAYMNYTIHVESTEVGSSREVEPKSSHSSSDCLALVKQLVKRKGFSKAETGYFASCLLKSTRVSYQIVEILENGAWLESFQPPSLFNNITNCMLFLDTEMFNSLYREL